MLRDNIYIHPPSFLFLCLWECDISIEGRRPGHRTEYSAHVFNVKTSPAGSCSIFPQSTWALCPKRWDFLCIQVTGCAQDGCWWLVVWSIRVIVVVDLGDVEKFAPGFLLLTLPNKHIQLVHKMIQVVPIALDVEANRSMIMK